MSREDLQPAYVLHLRHYRDTSAIVDFFTRDFGRISGLVKGVFRQSRANLRIRGLLQPNRALLISWSGRHELKTVTKVELQGLPVPLQGTALFSALYVNELLMRSLQSYDCHAGLFDHFDALVRGLGQAGEPIEQQLRGFEFALLRELGYQIDFAYDGVSGEPISAEAYYAYHPESGFTRLDTSVPGGAVAARADEELVLSGAQISAVGRLELDDPAVRRAAKRLARIALRPHIGDRPLKSRELFT